MKLLKNVPITNVSVLIVYMNCTESYRSI